MNTYLQLNTVTFIFIARKANTFIIRMFKMTAVTLTTHARSFGTIYHPRADGAKRLARILIPHGYFCPRGNESIREV